MSRLLETVGLNTDDLLYDTQQAAYNAMDCAVTAEVYETLQGFGSGGFAYNMARAMQAPAFVMSMRGIKIDLAARDEVLHSQDGLFAKLQNYQGLWDRLTLEGVGVEVNPRSPPQLLKLFHEYLPFDPVRSFNKITKEYQPSTSRDALEKLRLKEPLSRPLVNLLFAMRDLKKKIDVLTVGLEAGRLHCNYNVVGTLTGRWSSSEWSFGGGMNLQNITDEMRSVFVADEGKKLCYVDLQQAESVVMAHLCLPWGSNYLEACRSGDPHTYVTRMVWPDLAWTGDLSSDKDVAETKFYRHLSHRDMSKKGGHGSNYGGTPPVLAMHMAISTYLAENFQRQYFQQFPEIKKYQNWVKQKLAQDRTISTPLGRVCQFPGRPWDNDTIKSAIAYCPQSSIGDILNLGLLKVFNLFDTRKILVQPKGVEILLQVHDAIVFQYPEEIENEIVPKVIEELVVPVEINGETCRIGCDAMVGWNWGKRIVKKDGSVKNPHGLAKFSRSGDGRVAPKIFSILDRPIYHSHKAS